MNIKLILALVSIGNCWGTKRSSRFSENKQWYEPVKQERLILMPISSFFVERAFEQMQIIAKRGYPAALYLVNDPNIDRFKATINDFLILGIKESEDHISNILSNIGKLHNFSFFDRIIMDQFAQGMPILQVEALDFRPRLDDIFYLEKQIAQQILARISQILNPRLLGRL